jgi:hypothetical protein
MEREVREEEEEERQRCYARRRVEWGYFAAKCPAFQQLGGTQHISQGLISLC